MKPVYTGRCLCGEIKEKDTPWIDGEAYPHHVFYYDHNGLTSGHPCPGVFVNCTGRTDKEIYAALDDLRSRLQLS